jgi:hypothetical protein
LLPLFRITMVTKKREKNECELICKVCDFKCCYKSDFNRHIVTAKHKTITMVTKKQVENEKSHMCMCGKKYIHISGLSRHKLHCNKSDGSNTSTSIVETINSNAFVMNLISQNKELMNLLVVQNQENKEMHKTIKDIIPKIGNNNNNNTTNNTQFNLQVFLNEDCKDAINFSDFIETIKVSFEDLENQAENGYIKGISKLFIENLQGLGINRRPIHCTDKKRKTLYIKENDAWDKEGSQDTLKKGIQEVSRRTFEELIKSKEENDEEYKDADSEFSEKCISIQRNLVPNYPRDTTINKVIENITQKTGII